jgi:hypothetical protein
MRSHNARSGKEVVLLLDKPPTRKKPFRNHNGVDCKAASKLHCIDGCLELPRNYLLMAGAKKRYLDPPSWLLIPSEIVPEKRVLLFDLLTKL